MRRLILILLVLLGLAPLSAGAASPDDVDTGDRAGRNLRPLLSLLAQDGALPPDLADVASALRDAEDATAARRLLTDLLPALSRHRARTQSAARRGLVRARPSRAGEFRAKATVRSPDPWLRLAPVDDDSAALHAPLTTVWLQATRENADQDSRDGIDGFELDADGAVIGLEREITPALVLGIAGGRNDAAVDSGDRGRDDTTASDYLAYASFATGRHRFDLLTSARLAEIDRRRVVRVPRADAPRLVVLNADVRTEELLYSAGWHYQAALAGGWSMSPGVSLSHVSLSTDDYVETGGGALGLRVETADVAETLASASLTLDHLTYAGAWAWAVGARVTVERTLDADDTVTTSTFTGTRFGFTSRGYTVAQTRWSGSAGLSAYHPSGFGVSLSVALERQADYRYTATSLGLEWMF